MGILQLAADDRNIEPENRMNTVSILSRHINDSLKYQRDFGTKDKSIYIWAFIKVGKFFGAYCTLLYCLVKGLYLTNVVGQFILLNRFLETNEYPFFGAHIVWDLLHVRGLVLVSAYTQFVLEDGPNHNSCNVSFSFLNDEPFTFGMMIHLVQSVIHCHLPFDIMIHHNL